MNGQKVDSPIYVFHQNIQSLRAKTFELEVFLDTKRPSILCFTEHWLHEEEVPVINGYYMSACHYRRGAHGGSCIYINDQYESFKMDEIMSLSVDNILECSCCRVKELKLIIVCIYRTPRSDVDTFIDRMVQILEALDSKSLNNYIAICGDFNLDLLAIEGTQKLRANCFLNTLLSYGYRQTVYEATRITATTQTLIDNIFVNEYPAPRSDVISAALSDHKGGKAPGEYVSKKKRRFTYSGDDPRRSLQKKYIRATRCKRLETR